MCVCVCDIFVCELTTPGVDSYRVGGLNGEVVFINKEMKEKKLTDELLLEYLREMA